MQITCCREKSGKLFFKGENVLLIKAQVGPSHMRIIIHDYLPGGILVYVGPYTNLLTTVSQHLPIVHVSRDVRLNSLVSGKYFEFLGRKDLEKGKVLLQILADKCGGGWCTTNSCLLVTFQPTGLLDMSRLIHFYTSHPSWQIITRPSNSGSG